MVVTCESIELRAEKREVQFEVKGVLFVCVVIVDLIEEKTRVERVRIRRFIDKSEERGGQAFKECGG